MNVLRLVDVPLTDRTATVCAGWWPWPIPSPRRRNTCQRAVRPTADPTAFRSQPTGPYADRTHKSSTWTRWSDNWSDSAGGWICSCWKITYMSYNLCQSANALLWFLLEIPNIYTYFYIYFPSKIIKTLYAQIISKPNIVLLSEKYILKKYIIVKYNVEIVNWIPRRLVTVG